MAMAALWLSLAGAATAADPSCSAGGSSSSSDGSCSEHAAAAGGPPSWSLAPLQLPGHARAETSDWPLIIGASPGTTGTMSLYYALKALDVSVVHYTRQYNASSGVESTSYELGGGPVPLLKPLFADTQPAPPVDLKAARSADLRFLAATDALLDTPAQEIFFDLLATFPNARVVLTLRDPTAWAASRRQRHPTDRSPVLSLFDIEAPIGALSVEQGATALALWHKVVAGSVPVERLLLLDVFSMASDELWRRLCAFLGRPLPPRDATTGELPPFPKMGYGDDVRLDAGGGGGAN